jgi:hypothetical protein
MTGFAEPDGMVFSNITVAGIPNNSNRGNQGGCHVRVHQLMNKDQEVPMSPEGYNKAEQYGKHVLAKRREKCESIKNC